MRTAKSHSSPVRKAAIRNWAKTMTEFTQEPKQQTASFARRGRAALLAALVLGGGGLLPAAAETMEYRLATMDRLRVRIAEWQTAEATVRDWSVVSGDYLVGPAGTISMPLVGNLQAAGKTPEELAGEIGSALQNQLGLRDLPSASVELAQYRPVYLSGDVQTPGEYPFVPNLTVLKAVSLAGGLRRSEAGQRFARDFINAKGESAVGLSERNRLLARRARLQAEIGGKKQLDLPAELQDVPEAESLLASEEALLVSRDRKLERQLAALDDLKTLLQNEIDALRKKSETQGRQLELAMEDRDKIKSLTEKGLAVSTRQLSIEQKTAELQADLLDIDTATLKARQDLSKAAADEVALENDRDAQLAGELQDTEAQLEKLALQLATSGELMAEALTQSADSARLDQKASSIVYKIVRESDGEVKEMPASETSGLLPGDVIKVESALFTQ